MIVKDKKTTKDKLFNQIGLNSYYRTYQKRMDLGSNPIDSILNRERLVEAEKCFNDPQVSTCFLILAFSLMKKEIVFKAIDDGLKKDINKSKKMADLLNFSLKKLKDGGTQQLVFDLFTSKFFGWSLVEKIYSVLNSSQSKKWAGYYYYEYMQAKKIGLWDFAYNEAGRVIGFQSLVNKEVYPLEKFMSISYLPLFNNKIGTPDFSRVWSVWDAKAEFIILILDLGSRLSKGRQAVLKNTGTAATITDEVKDALLEDLSANLNIYIPVGLELDFHNFDVGALQYFIQVLKWLDSQIAIAMIGSSLSVNESQGSGTNAQSQVHNENKYTFQEYIENLIKDCFDESYAYDLLKLNFNNEEYPEELYPTCELIDTTEETPLEKANLMKILKDMGILDTDTETDLNYLREKFELPENKEIFDSVDSILNKVKDNKGNQDMTSLNDNNSDNNSDNLDDSNVSTMYN